MEIAAKTITPPPITEPTDPFRPFFTQIAGDENSDRSSKLDHDKSNEI